MKISEKKYKTAWNEMVSPVTAHIDARPLYLNKENLYKCYEKAVNIAGGVDTLVDKTVLDFGCGGGFFFKYLAENKIYIKKYTGFDISERSILAAISNSTGVDGSFVKPTFMEICPNIFPYLPCLKIDILFSLSVIQHFPTESYLYFFLREMDESRISRLLLQIRHRDKNAFKRNPYKTAGDVVFACHTNKEYLCKWLPHYTLKNATEVGEKGCQYLYFERSSK